MPLFTYAGEPGRYYPTLGLTPEDGVAYELEAAPDERFVAPDATPVETVTETSSTDDTEGN